MNKPIIRRSHLGPLAVGCAMLAICCGAQAADWPMWRADASRSAASQQRLVDELHPQWTLWLPALAAAWPDQPKMWFDAQYEPVVAGRRMFFGSSGDDSLSAVDTRTGALLWKFPVDGPIRFPPVVHDNKVFLTADDGYLYCVDAALGRLLWKFRGGPSDRRILGNERLTSMWPARGAPVVADGKVYFAASIWPFMGVFLHALDAETGAVVWTNDGDGSRFMLQPHTTYSFAGVAPQGALVVSGDYLLVPGGRSVPACYDRHTGRLVHYELAANSKKGGGSAVAAGERMIFNGGYVYGIDRGDILDGLRYTQHAVIDPQRVYLADGDKVKAVEFGDPLYQEKAAVDRRGKPIKIRQLDARTLWSHRLGTTNDLIRAGERLYGCSDEAVWAIDLTAAADAGNLQPVWQAAPEGTPVRLLAADERLFVVTREGAIHCFGAEQTTPRAHDRRPTPPTLTEAARQQADELLQSLNRPSGYLVFLGAPTAELAQALLADEQLRLVIIEPAEDKAAALRQTLTSAGLYGPRASLLVGTLDTLELPPYFASAAICEDPAAAALEPTTRQLKNLFHCLRPYGGTARLRWDASAQDRLKSLVEQAELPGAVLRGDGPHALLVREGALPGAANWTHEHADAANTRTSPDQLVKLPLGMLWYGGPPHHDILPRHGHGPQPQVVDGRAIIEGPDVLRALDIYTGRLLWQRPLPKVGALYDNTSHHPGANGTGANYISHPQGIYVIYAPGCVQLDPDTGNTVAEFSLPPAAGSVEPPVWNYINVVDDYLIAGINLPDSLIDPGRRSYEDEIACKRLYVLDRRSGEILWSADAEYQFRNNAICAGGGRLYAIDLLSEVEKGLWRRRGETPTARSRLSAFDLRSGQTIWTTDDDIFGTWLSYSSEYDVLVESGRPGRDVLRDEPSGMRAYRAAEGEVLWKQGHRGPAILHGDRILIDRLACELLTGELVKRTDPLSGAEVNWSWSRNYGCNTPQASQHLMLFRSGAAGYFDLAGDGGTGNFGGFRSGCSNNLIAAGGVLCAPDYTRTCTCDYQNQASLALVHMPDVEIWTEFPYASVKNIRRLGLNLGAPGYRRAEDGLLWLHEFPGAELEHDDGGLFRRHSSQVEGNRLAWVAASGCRGARRLTIDPRRESAGSFTLRLHFCDFDNAAPGQRRFDVKLQGQTVLEQFDIVAAAGGPRRPVTREFQKIGIEPGQPVTLEFVSPATEPHAAPLINGVELILEEP